MWDERNYTNVTIAKQTVTAFQFTFSDWVFPWSCSTVRLLVGKRSSQLSMSKMQHIRIMKILHFQLNEFVNRFESEGPGVVEDMDKGLKLMEIYAVEFEKLEATRLEMGK